MFKRFSIALLSIVFSAQAYSAGYVGEGKIRKMQSAYGTWLFMTTGPQSNPDGCTTGNGQVIVLPLDHPQHKEIYSFLLAAYTASKPVNIYVADCDQHGYKKLNFVNSSW